MTQTIQETIQQLHDSLQDYIEATYHISAPSLIKQRKELLAQPGVIHQVPYLESTPRYKAGENFAAMEGLPHAALHIFGLLSRKDENHQKLIFDPPYKHQSDSIRYGLIDGKNLVITTGTGSGKTESFLLPILGKLAREAQANPSGFLRQSAMRALILYPMNALVNDQLGRLRSLFGNRRLVKQFREWSGRPPRFARYTSRTPYAGIRTKEKDSVRLKSFSDFYVDIEHRINGDDPDDKEAAIELRKKLQDCGKWPAKPDLESWYGQKGKDWQDRKTKEFIRAVTLPNDSELLTRHEVQVAPPDLLVTNYSMLEYMLMRPIERSIFDKTREWLTSNPAENFLVVLDEAHLYRGAGGAEVGLLIRRLRDRLGVPTERFQVICATASFSDKDYAAEFGAQISGLSVDTFESVTGELDLRPDAGIGLQQDANALASIDLDAYYKADSNEKRLSVIKSLLDYRHVDDEGVPEKALYHALATFGPMGRLINVTMQNALPIAQLGHKIFPKASCEVADAAVTALMALGSIARTDPDTPGLLPCRVHNFFRGLAGLWVCMDPACKEVPNSLKGKICGRMYSQPRELCNCGSRVLELYTCRNCGTAYARAYTDDVDEPTVLWAEPGERLRTASTETGPLFPLDLLLEQPIEDEVAEPAAYDLETGRLNPKNSGPRERIVYIRNERSTDTSDQGNKGIANFETRGEFKPCAVCGEKARYGRSYVQDHQTKGDEPFQTLVSRQVHIQHPGAIPASDFAPLQGRKVLTFSDSRQVAARLAPKLQMYSERDSLRPLIAWGFMRLQRVDKLQSLLSLEELYFAVLLAAKTLGVRLRPELKSGENFNAEALIESAIKDGTADSSEGLLTLWGKMRVESPPESLLENIVTTIQSRFWGLEALALASIVERNDHTPKLAELPPISGIAETHEAKIALARTWLRCWQSEGFWLSTMPPGWENRSRTEGVSVRTRSPRSEFRALRKILKNRGSRKLFSSRWVPELFKIFTENTTSNNRRLAGKELSLQFDGTWAHCSACKSAHRPIPSYPICINCGSPEVRQLFPDTDEVFSARKGYYRKPVFEALQIPPKTPMALIVAEHTAQLNAPQNDNVFSKAEENELLFQDIPLTGSSAAGRSTAIDVLSCTTTMEVGIDLGALSGVALRNMPPERANYQQRSGRAGRRGKAIATVVAFGSSDSHDEHYFSKPDGMIRGDVIDPNLTLDNSEIVQRHIRAFLLQSYHQDRLPMVTAEYSHDLFSVLGNVSDFRNGTSVLNRDDFATWLAENDAYLQERVASWIPKELSITERDRLLSSMTKNCLKAVDFAIGISSHEEVSNSEVDEYVEEQAETGEERPRQASRLGKLLDRLLYRGILPRYAFPTDVATFHVFDREHSTVYRPVMRFTPSQSLSVALSQYAPGKEVWISGKCYRSGAVYSVVADERHKAWESRRIYLECNQCHYVDTDSIGNISVGHIKDCPACNSEGSFGPARNWMRPPGFAHPIDVEEVTSPEDLPEVSYATRAKLTMGTPEDEKKWVVINEHLRALRERKHLLVSNSGPGNEGYSYCTKCGLIEASKTPNPKLTMPHNKPFPAKDEDKICSGDRTSRHLVLGTDFITDISLFSLRVPPPLNLQPGHTSTIVALRTISEALTKAACHMLEIGMGELFAEFRPAVTPAGKSGKEAEIFFYDTLPGGAGFSSQLPEYGLEIFKQALMVMKDCPEGCDTSCYRCLRSFKNKLEHRLLDRHVGVQLLEHLLYDNPTEFNATRMQSSTNLLASDLHRQMEDDAKIETNISINTRVGMITAPILITRNGRQKIVALTSPLTDGYPADPKIAELYESDSDVPVLLVNELIVRANLPFATLGIRNKLGII